MISDTSAQDRAVTPPAGRRRNRRLLQAGLALAAVALVLWLVMSWASSDRSVSTARLRTGEVTRGNFVRDVSVEGRVVAAVSPTLYAPVGGTVTLAIQAGATVKRGALLATIESPELTNELAREESTLASLEAEVGRQRITSRQASLLARRTQDEAHLALTTANRNLQRSERGHQLGVVSEVDLLAAQDAVRSAQIRLRHASDDRGLATQSTGFDLTTRERALERQALVVANLTRRVQDLQIRAPVDGIVGTVAVTDRAVVVANAPLITVVDLSRLEVELEAPETYADDLGIGMTADVRIGSVQAPGKISAISPEVVANRVRVRVAFEGDQPAGLRQNQRVNARILIDERADTLMLPRGPFIEAQGGRSAWVVDGNVAVRRAVRLGSTSVTHVEVIDGLAEGDVVVTAGTETFADAERVQLND